MEQAYASACRVAVPQYYLDLFSRAPSLLLSPSLNVFLGDIWRFEVGGGIDRSDQILFHRLLFSYTRDRE